MGFYENMTIVVVVRPAWRLGLHGFLLEVRRSAMLHYTVNQHLHSTSPIAELLWV